MKILLANTLFPPFAVGGTEVVVRETLTGLAAAGHDVCLVTTQPTKPAIGLWDLRTIHGFRTYRFRPQNVYYYTEGAKKSIVLKLAWHAIDTNNRYDATVLRSILKRERPDLVHGHNLKGMSYTLPEICFELGIPYIHTLHNYQLLHPYGTFTIAETPPYFRPKLAAKLYQVWNRKKFQHVSGVITPTALPLQLHQQVGFFQNTLTAHIPSPVEFRVTTHRAETGIRLAFFGALEEIKGIRSLILATQHLPQHGWLLDIFGRGTLENEMRSRSKENPNIRWRGHVDDPSLLSAYDALVYPSECWETQGLAIAESLVQGTPVVAARIGSIPETIHDGENGFLYTSGDVAALTTLLAKLIDQPERLTGMRKAAHESSARFSVPKYVDALQKFYSSCNTAALTVNNIS